MRLLAWFNVKVLSPIIWAVEKRFGYYSKIAKRLRRIGHMLPCYGWEDD